VSESSQAVVSPLRREGRTARTTSADAAIYVAANVVNKGVMFLMAPLLAHYLAPDDFGRIAIFLAFCGIATVLVGYNSNGAVLLQALDPKERDLASYVGTVVASIAIGSTVLSLIVLVTGAAVVSRLQLPREWILAAVVVGGLNAVTAAALAVWQAQRRPALYAAANLGQSALNAGMSLFLVVVAGLGWQGRTNAVVFSAMTGAVAAIWLLRRDGLIRPALDRHAGKDAAAYGIPLIPHALAAWIMEGIDRVWLGSAISLLAAGVYAAGYQVGMIVAFVASSVNTAWAPVILRELGEADYRGRRRLVRQMYGLMLMFFSLALVLALLARMITATVFPATYAAAAPVIGWVAAGYACHAAYMLLGNLISHSRKTHWLSAITVGCATLNLGLNAILIPRYGGVGAAQATFFTYFAFMVLTWAVGQRVCPLPWLSSIARA